jgi:hypothetical protein
MTPKEKAEELVLKFREVPIEDSVMWYVGYEISKEFALIAVNEIIKSNPLLPQTLDWSKVKQEIEKL